MTFGTIFDTFKGFFSRGFWFSNFLPVVIVGFLHASLAALVFHIDLLGWLGSAAGPTAGDASIVFAALVVVAYALAPLTPLFGGLLDGSLAPRWLHDKLRAARADAWRADDAEWRMAVAADAAADQAAREVPAQLAAAAAKGRDPSTPADADFSGKAGSIAEAHRLLEKLNDIAWDKAVQPVRPIPLKRLLRIVDQLVDALGRNTAPFNSDPLNARDLTRLADIRKKLIELLVSLRNDARQRLRDVSDRLELYDPQTWQATRLGDARYALRRYVRDTYDVEFGYLWPRVRMAFVEGDAADGKGLPRQVSDAAAQVDFAVALLALAASVPLVWLVVIVACGGPLGVFVPLAIAAPLALLLLYELVVRSEIAFGGVGRTAIDRYRLTVLTLLSLPLPVTFSAERELWAKLATTCLPDTNPDLVFSHVKAAAP